MKTIIITGGSSGLGLELIKLFLSNNFRVINLSRKEPRIDLNLKDNLIHIKTNLNCNKSIQRTIENIKLNYSKFDYLFLNSGIWNFEMIEDINFNKVDEIIKVSFDI